MPAMGGTLWQSVRAATLPVAQSSGQVPASDRLRAAASKIAITLHRRYALANSETAKTGNPVASSQSRNPPYTRVPFLPEFDNEDRF